MKRNELSRQEFLSGFMKSVSAFAIGSAISTLPDEAQGGHLLTSRGGKEADSFSHKLPQRVLGRTGVKVSALGMGGAEYFQHVTDKEAVELILNRAIDGGINYFDTARNYERSEENFGLVLSRRRKELFLATKCEERSYNGALRDVETSLKKLQTDRIDLIQVHHIYDKDDVPALGRKDGVIPALQRLQKEKVVRFIGMTGHPDYRAVKQALTLYDCWDAFMGFINPRASTRPMYDEQLPIALKKQMGIVAMKVFGGSTPAELIGAGPGRAPARQLLRYALSQAITVAIPAVSSLAELEENLEVARDFKPMPAEERESLIARINEQPSQNAAPRSAHG